jgi:hypothetical protein
MIGTPRTREVTKVDLPAQIACIKREIALRERVYPRQVAAGRMTDGKAASELATMRAVLALLEHFSLFFELDPRPSLIDYIRATPGLGGDPPA